MKQTRTKKSIINLLYSLSCQLIIFFLEFHVYRKFSNSLGIVYLGIDNIFSNILIIISMPNLGIIAAIAYSLYEPLANKNIKKLIAVTRFLRRTGFFMGTVFGVLGILFTMHMELFANNLRKIPNVELYYILFLANTILPYFFAHRRLLILNDQKKYIIALILFASKIIELTAKLIIFNICKNFLLFATCNVCATLVEGIATFIISNKLYPFLRCKLEETLPAEEKKKIIKNASGMFLNQVFGLLIHTIDTIYISKFAGLIISGIYLPYTKIINSLKTVNLQFCESVSASFGNLAVMKDVKKLEKRFHDILFLANYFLSIIFCNLMVNFSFIIKIWMPRNHLLSRTVVIIILINFYLMSVRKIVKMAKENVGIYWQGRYVTLYEAIINFILAFWGAKLFGIAGILGSTTISILLTCFWWEPWLLYKYGFKSSFMVYLKKQLIYYSLTAICCVICTYGCRLVTADGWEKIFYNTLMISCIHAILFFFTFRNYEEFLFLKKLIFSKIKSKKDGF